MSSSVTDEILRASGSSSGTRVCLYSWAQAKGVLTSPTHNLENAFSFASLLNAEYRKGTFGGRGWGTSGGLSDLQRESIHCCSGFTFCGIRVLPVLLTRKAWAWLEVRRQGLACYCAAFWDCSNFRRLF